MISLKEQRPGESDDRAGSQKGNTTPAQGETLPTEVPRLPHEQDESADSQRAEDRPSANRTEQAYRDLVGGVVDTDRRSAHENQQIQGRLDQRNVERRKQPR